MTDSSSGGYGGLVFLLLIVAAFVLLVVLPQRRRAQAARRVADSVHAGAQVMMTSGLFGTVATVEGDSIWLEVAPGVTNRYLRQAVARVVDPPLVPPQDRPEDPGSVQLDKPE